MQATRGEFHTWMMLLCLAVLCLAAMPAHAQYSSGIEATIVDQNDAVIPLAQVMLTIRRHMLSRPPLQMARAWCRSRIFLPAATRSL
jgi:hypothetical protein